MARASAKKASGGSGKVSSLSDIPAVSAYLTRIGAEVRSLLTAVVKESHGRYWRDLAIIRFARDGGVRTTAEFMPTDVEASAIREAFTTIKLPSAVRPKKLPKLPAMVAKADPKDVFYFWSVEKDFIMLQLRVESKDGGRNYIPWSYWDDNEWRPMEPEGDLPLWGLEQLTNASTVFIHEGAKAARYCRDMVEGKTPEAREAFKNHPWAEELNNAAHLGWIGGALSPTRTDWSQLKKHGITRVYIVSDNDDAGVQAVPAISQAIRLPTFHVMFTNQWPASFDLADAFPKKLYKKLGKETYYVGPSFRQCVHPATWATDIVQLKDDEGKPRKGQGVAVLRPNFIGMWSYIEKADMYVCNEMPEIVRDESTLNKMLAGFSHSKQTASLIVGAYKGRTTGVCYRPDESGRLITDGTSSAINLHTPTHIKSVKGDITPFIDFLKYLIPIPKERLEVEKFCATLIARPDIRIKYGLLLVSERQGVGKNTLGEHILAPLVGIQNASFPSEDQIVKSEFNGWIARKRLVVVGEIYSGHSWKAYNNLKAKITDKHIDVNEKFEKPYTIENWAHIVAFSNSMRALKIEQDDRRWFYPKVTEARWSKQQFGEFYNWLTGGGLGIIKNWAEHFTNYVDPGDDAPMTDKKKELIMESRTDAQKEVMTLAELMLSHDKPIALTMTDIVAWARANVQGRVYDSDHELRKAMKDAGVTFTEDRIKVQGRPQYVAYNPLVVKAMEEAYANAYDEALEHVVIVPKGEDRTTAKEAHATEFATKKRGEVVRANIKKPQDLQEDSM